MNLRNYARLRRAVRERDPKRFDYRTALDPECGCVVPIARRLWGDQTNLVKELDIAGLEASFILGWSAPGLSGTPFARMTAKEATGRAGIREALRRLSVVRRRYDAEGRPKGAQ